MFISVIAKAILIDAARQIDFGLNDDDEAVDDAQPLIDSQVRTDWGLEGVQGHFLVIFDDSTPS